MQTIIFDVDDTLYDQLQPFRNAVHQQLDISYNEKQIEALYLSSRKYSDKVFEKHMNGDITALELQTYRITEACKDFGLTLSHQQAAAFQEAYLNEQNQIRLFSEIEMLLDHLSMNKYQLAVLTNGEVDHQMMKVKQLGITKWIPEENIFVSAGIGYSKPNRKVFEHLENKLNLSKENTIYIGDSFENDIIGAKQVGWKATWMNHRFRKKPISNYKPDYTINNPEDLLAIFGLKEKHVTG
ncbi:HAD family hydrolase [Gracilibacillus kekensis]|uniref:Putative hydrolase of the HAD superfamily n=1 Tax=Gracilibacillus kekensis TaxID=1027249 RepID=A0A1M7L3P0_9BACI|nr:HAD family hydrolase [Gracilibacillus kekensis]SHM72475.1 putative hydrolase of the HAD superfamily [Gracilibacillus kekensis]